MKKILLIALAALLVFTLAACGPDDSTNLTGTSEDVLSQILERAPENISDDNPLPAMAPNAAVTADISLGLGIDADAFGRLVTDGTFSTAEIMNFAQEIAVFRTNDAADARELKQIIADNYDSSKWICVHPEQSVVIESGSYVLLAVGRAAHVDAIVEAFREAAGNTGDAEVFFTSEGMGDMDGGGGMTVEF